MLFGGYLGMVRMAQRLDIGFVKFPIGCDADINDMMKIGRLGYDGFPLAFHA